MIDDAVYTNKYGGRADFFVHEMKPTVELTIYSEELNRDLIKHRFSDLPEAIQKIDLGARFDLVDQPQIFNFVSVAREQAKFKLIVRFGFSAVDWKMPWSFSEYLQEFFEIISVAYPNISISDEESESPRRSLVVAIDEMNSAIEGKSEHERKLLREVHELAERNLASRIQRNAIVMFFDFPAEVRTVCEQYLLYFAQFLKDLGVEAETALTHEAGQALFTVIPVDQSQALDNIRAALDVYLQLPSNPISDATNDSIAIQRLESNVLRLRADLKLAAAEQQAQAKTIEAQQLIMDVQKGLLTGKVMVNSIKNVTPKPENDEKEEFLGGTVSLIPIKGKGVEITST